MQNYLELLRDVLENGVYKGDRTGTGTYSVFSRTLRYDLQEGFPLVTTKKVHFKSVVHELLWFLSGDTNTKYLTDNGVRIWNEWADDNGDLGKIYGYQWRNFGGVDQIKEIIYSIKNNPDSRRHIVNAWNVGELHEMALPPCHLFFQFYVNEGRLSCQFYMRSSDVFLGLPFNIASYALLTHMVALECGLQVGELVYVGCDVHLYSNHTEQAKTQLQREPLALPEIKINNFKSIFSCKYEDIELVNYKAHPSIKAPVAV